MVYMRFPNRIRDKSNLWVVVPNKPRYKMNNEFTLPVAFQEKHASHITSMNDTILVILLNEEQGIEALN